MTVNTKPQALVTIGISILFLLCILVQAVEAGPSNWPPESPIPGVETDMHTAPIWRLSVDAQERFLVTASKDKTARVWDLSGKLLQILRVPVGEDPREGQLFCVAISPNGEDIATAGFTGTKSLKDNFFIYIFDRESGRIKHAIRDLPAEVSHLTFSRDGQLLAATLVGEQGLRVYNSHDWSEVYRDKDYTYDSYGADFGPQNRLVTTSYDGSLRLYKTVDGKFKRILIKSPRKGAKPVTARFSPDGNLLAVGFMDSPRVNVLSGETLEPLYAPDTKGLDKGHLARVAWSRDGTLLYAAGNLADAGIRSILRWTGKGQGPATRLPASLDSTMDLYPLSDGRLVYGAADPSFGVLDPAGHRLLAKIPDIPNFRGKQEHLKVSADGNLVEFGFAVQNPDLRQTLHLARLNLQTHRLTLDPTANSGSDKLHPPTTAGFRDSDWKEKRARFRDRPLYPDELEKAHSLCLIPEGEGFLMGTDWYLYSFDKNGARRWRANLPSTAWGVNVSSNGQVAVAALGDGTLRWYRLQDGKEILAFLLHRDGRWVLWSPAGFFDADGGGQALIGYYLNHGPDRSPDFIKAAQMFERFYRPDLVTKLLAEVSGRKMKEDLGRFGNVRELLPGNPPPAVKLLSVSRDGPCVTLKFRIKDQGGGIGDPILFDNGVTVASAAARPLEPGFEELPQERTVELRLTLDPGKHDLRFANKDAKNEFESSPAIATVNVESQKPLRKSLFGLCVGITRYQDSKLNLKYPAKDAASVKQALQEGEGPLFEKVEIENLADESATLNNIQAAFADLANPKRAGQKMRQTDVFVLYLAGHGTIDEDGKYHFIPWEFQPNPGAQGGLKATLSHDTLIKLLEKIPARTRLVILDTCHSGAFSLLPGDEESETVEAQKTKSAFIRLYNQNARALLAASSKKEWALEGYENHGVFTYALLQGLKEADADDGKIFIDDLAKFVVKKVPRITQEKWKRQQTAIRELGGETFEIAVTHK